MENKIVKMFVLVNMYDYQGLGRNQYYGTAFISENAKHNARVAMQTQDAFPDVASVIYEYNIEITPFMIGYRVHLVGVDTMNKKADTLTITQWKRMGKEAQSIIQTRLVEMC